MPYKISSFTLIYIILFQVWCLGMFIFRKPMVNFTPTFTQDLLEQREKFRLLWFPLCRGVWI